MKIVITDSQRRKFQLCKGIRDFNVIYKQEMREENLIDDCHDADVIIVDKTPITETLLSKVEHCKLIVRMGVGFDNVDLEYARSRNIDVCNIPDFCINEVADHAISMILAFSRNIFDYNEHIVNKAKKWSPFPSDIFPSKRLSDATVGIVGLGRIGTALAIRLKAFYCNIVFYDPYIPKGMHKSLGIKESDCIKKMLRQCDFVSMHVPLNAETKYMVDQGFLSDMKDDAYLINTSRGKIVDTDSLVKALDKGKLAGAGLDVYEVEPFLEFTPLIKFKQENPSRLILTPHCAFYSKESDEELQNTAIEIIIDMQQGKRLINVVN